MSPNTAAYVLDTPAGQVVVPTLALPVILGVLGGLLIALWLVQRRRSHR